MAEEKPPEELPGVLKHILWPGASDVFYHYCSVETFRLICEKKTLRFSDINMMNDYQENAWGYRIFEEAAGLMLRKPAPPGLEGLDKSFFDAVDKIISPAQFIAHPLLCSFSREPDVLSQWRAYADDGTGVAVGFSGDALKALPCMLLNVEYDRQRQIADMIETLGSLYVAEMGRKHSRGTEFKEMCMQLAIFKIAFKNLAFKEEKEVRSIHLLAVKTDGNLPRLVDDGGLTHGKDLVNGQPVKFRTRGDGLIAYIDIPLTMPDTCDPIKEIWLGPKNGNWPGNVMYMMSGYGLKEFNIKRSLASYR
jgi:hypothetical protein